MRFFDKETIEEERHNKDSFKDRDLALEINGWYLSIGENTSKYVNPIGSKVWLGVSSAYEEEESRFISKDEAIDIIVKLKQLFNV